MERAVTRFVLLFAALSLPLLAVAQPCSEPEASQFDFWVGQWEVHANGKLAGHNTISRIHGGCTLLEEFSGAAGPYEGKSFNYYDATDGQWHQVWVDNSGTRLHLAGGFHEAAMSMSGKRIAQGAEILDRITWTPNDDGTVRQLWEMSTDGGTSFRTLFDGLYRPVGSQ